jgi:hypothetical protein
MPSTKEGDRMSIDIIIGLLTQISKDLKDIKKRLNKRG